MIKRMIAPVSAVALAALLSGCAALSPPVKTVKLNPTVPSYSTMDATMRGVFIAPKPDGKGYYVCAEPSPDVALSTTMQLIAQAQLNNPNVDAQVQLEFQTAVVQLTQRTETITFLREALYRLCEASINDTLTPDQVMQQYDTALKTALTLAQADLAKNQADAGKALSNPQVRDLWIKTFGQPPAPEAQPAKK